jgi:predicted metalloprotease with PDZ domain
LKINFQLYNLFGTVMSALATDGPKPRLLVVRSKKSEKEKLGFTVTGSKTRPGMHEISNVKQCSAASKAGLRKGDLIVGVASKNALDMTYLELVTLIQKKKLEGDVVLMVTNPYEVEFYKSKIVPVLFF